MILTTRSVRMKNAGVIRGAALLGMAALAAGCSVVDSNGYSRELAYIEYGGSPVQIVLPATARVEEPVAVSVTTYGSGCAQKGDTQVSVSAQVAELRPYDLYDEESDCPDILRTFVHEAEVIFEQPGTATLRVHGRTSDGGRTIVETRTITVQPAS